MKVGSWSVYVDSVYIAFHRPRRPPYGCTDVTRTPKDTALDEVTATFLASLQKDEGHPPPDRRLHQRIGWLAPVGALIAYGAWSWAAGRIAALLGTAGDFLHDLAAIALITGPLFASMWWSARQQKGAAWEALGFWTGLALVAAWITTL